MRVQTVSLQKDQKDNRKQVKRKNKINIENYPSKNDKSPGLNKSSKNGN